MNFIALREGPQGLVALSADKKLGVSFGKIPNKAVGKRQLFDFVVVSKKEIRYRHAIVASSKVDNKIVPIATEFHLLGR
ncbi:hypothetical protein STW0522KLE44_19500 [Klebsiella sp. STW0522-44]|nr:hypothetical protein STW0522KLE44_19500 [Klebsiella sp. STW0522-44]